MLLPLTQSVHNLFHSFNFLFLEKAEDVHLKFIETIVIQIIKTQETYNIIGQYHSYKGISHTCMHGKD